jgi:uncharacterized protein (DUF697 family)
MVFLRGTGLQSHRTSNYVRRQEKAKAIVRKFSTLATAAGIIPLPFLDAISVFGIQVKMLYDLSKEYGVTFPESRAKVDILSLVGGAVPTTAGAAPTSVTEGIPYVGTAAGMVAVPIFSAASTLVLGWLFIRHFNAGGKLVDFDAKRTRMYFHSQCEAGKVVARKIARRPNQIEEPAAT